MLLLRNIDALVNLSAHNKRLPLKYHGPPTLEIYQSKQDLVTSLDDSRHGWFYDIRHCILARQTLRYAQYPLIPRQQ